MGTTAREAMTSMPAVELAELIARGDASSAEVVEAHIERIQRVNPILNAVVVERYDEARAEAREADRRRARGEPLGPLHGVPITIKDALDVAGTPSTFGLPSRASVLAERDDAYVARLRAAGAVILGKTNVAQCLLYYESDNPVYGRTNNPWNPDRTPGGSSGGEGAIIAAGGSPLGLGTDLGGSVRVPATFCGVPGIKPTAGRTPDAGRHSLPIGQQAIASQVGVLARTVTDVALGLEIINGVNVEPPLPLGDHRSVDVAGLRAAYYVDDGTFAVAPAVSRVVREAAHVLKERGASVAEWQPPDVGEAVHLCFALYSADGGRGISETVGRDRMDPRLRKLVAVAKMPGPARAAARRLLEAVGQPTMGRFLEHFGHTHTARYWDLVEAQMDYRRRFAEALDRAGIDVILCPACALPAFTHGASNDLGLAGGYAVLYNLLGYPAGVVPFDRVRKDEEVGRKPSRDRVEKAALKVERESAGLPVGVQVVARPWREHQALAVMRAIEQLRDGHPRQLPM
ncbi:MAG TPA: amidase family protein [Longimicrobiales bacterium]